MASTTQWVAGARLRTLPAAFAPVLVGTGAAAAVDGANMARAALALLIAVALQVGVNFANDYSDGVRGTDDDRVGPFRLVGSGAAEPRAVKLAAWASFTVAGLFGALLVAVSGHWWLLAVGAVAVAAAWFYTGGAHPYGYRGLGEVSVFVFFGLVAVVGTTYVQVGEFTGSSVIAGIAVGFLACALLLVNNLRDAPSDAASGKRTLAVFLGDKRTRITYLLLIATPFVLSLILAFAGRPWSALALIALPFAAWTAVPVYTRAKGKDLIPVLKNTSSTELAFAALLALGLTLS